MTWDMRKRVEMEFLEEFKFKIMGGGFQEGLISANKSFSGELAETHQVLLLLQPTEPGQNVQPKW